MKIKQYPNKVVDVVDVILNVFGIIKDGLFQKYISHGILLKGSSFTKF